MAVRSRHAVENSRAPAVCHRCIERFSKMRTNLIGEWGAHISGGVKPILLDPSVEELYALHTKSSM